MKRRNFILNSMLGGAFITRSADENTLLINKTPKLIGSNLGSIHEKDNSIDKKFEKEEPVIIEKYIPGQPHKGKVFAAIQPHCDDIAYFAGGTVAKLIAEGYTGYMIRTSNDDATGAGNSVGEQVLNNELSTDATTKALGLKKVYNLGYRNHRMEEYNIQELKGRLIFLFRLLKVDTVICYDPWSQYEENPDHYVTAKAVEAACWEAGSHDYPEQLEVVSPHAVSEKYYFARGPQIVNRVVDITDFIDIKVNSNVVIKSQGGGGDAGANIRKTLMTQGKKSSILGNDDATANFNYVKNFMLDIDSKYVRGVPSDREIGQKYGFDWGEQFHYIGLNESKAIDFIQKNSNY